MKYFGTDGIRGIVDNNLNCTIFKKLAKALAKFYELKGYKKILLVGNDSRISSDYILANVASGLLKYGIEIHNVGVCSSPSLAFIAQKFNYPLAMMISASHNPHEYNGIKFFNSFGEKISEQTEVEIEKLMDGHLKLKSANYAHLIDAHYLLDYYVLFLKQQKKYNYPCLFDCANGGVSEICKQVFSANEKLNCKPNGNNININAGCTHLEMLKSACIKNHMVGFAFDGDADRLIAVTENGEIVDGDKILFILSNHYLHAGDCLVGTIYTNMGLEKSIAKNKIKLIRANVGDKNVYNEMKTHSSILGGENSGHIILKHLSNTGDGLLNAISLINILVRTKLSFAELLKGYEQYCQVNLNIKLQGKFELTAELKNLIEKYSKLNTRIIIRPSGTEPVLRIMVEDKNKEKAEKILENLKNYIKNM